MDIASGRGSVLESNVCNVSDELERRAKGDEFINSCIAGQADKVKKMLEKDHSLINCCSLDGQTSPLMFAAKNGRASCVEVLLSHGAAVDHRIDDPALCIHSWTAYHFAVDGGKTDCVTALVDAGCDVCPPFRESARSKSTLAVNYRWLNQAHMTTPTVGLACVRLFAAW